MDVGRKKSYRAVMRRLQRPRPVMSVPLALSSVLSLALLVIATPVSSAHFSSPHRRVSLPPSPAISSAVQSSQATSSERRTNRPLDTSPTTTAKSPPSGDDIPPLTAPREALLSGFAGSPNAPLSLISIDAHTSVRLVVDAPADITIFDGACLVSRGVEVIIHNDSALSCTIALTTERLSEWQTFATA